MSDNKLEITIEEMSRLPEGSFALYDIRNDESFSYGSIPGAEHFPQDILEVKLGIRDVFVSLDHGYEIDSFDREKRIILFCARGEESLKPAELLSEMGYDAVSLTGGYNSWLIESLRKENETDGSEMAASSDSCSKQSDRLRGIERSIMKTHHKALFTPFAKAIRDYRLINPGDRIAVCISGGKDSFLMAKLFQEIKKHNKFSFELKYLVMDPGYNEVNRHVIESNARLLGIPIEVFESDIFDSVVNVEKSPCYLCARMRRGHLYSMAKSLDCNKIALGHHYDDVIETILMGMLYGGQIQTMMPKLHSTNFEGMELIRPLYLIREADIKRWRDENGLHFIQCACRFTDTCSTFDPEGHTYSKRMEIKKLIAELKKTNPFVEANIFKSMENVNLSTVIAYKKNGEKHLFTEEY